MADGNPFDSAATAAEPKKFKFRWVDANGNETGFFSSKKASFDGETLKLDDVEFPVDAILSMAVRDKYIAMVLPPHAGEDGESDGQPQHFTIAVYGTNAKTLKQMIDGARTDVFAEQERKDLQEKGLSSQYRDTKCPFCAATVSLSRLPETAQCYCQYCETLFTVGESAFGESEGLSRKQERKHRICEECNMYSQPRKFTIFYFIFLLYFISWSHRPTWRCPGCMRWDAWKMLFGNIFGFIGIPVAIVQLFRSYASKTTPGPLRGLDDANILANKGKIDKALDRYDRLMDNVPVNAGLKYNIGSGLLTKGDIPSAETMFELSLDDCANYFPSVRGLMYCYASQEKDAELKQLQKLHGWDDVPEEGEDFDEMVEA